MILTPSTHAGYELFHEGILALSQMESDGIRVDVDYLDKAIASSDIKIKALRDKLRTHDIGRMWQKRFGVKMNLDSREQLGEILFSPTDKGGMGFKSRAKTASGRPSTEIADLEVIDLGCVRGWLKYQKLQKAQGTYLKGIRREVVGDRCHPVYNLHLVVTFRSSCDSPNFQNQPVRDAEMGKLIRTSFIASEGHVLGEIDFKGAEVCVGACYHKDPVMIEYITDVTKDMHRDMAMQIYKLKKAQVSKQIRHAAKNKFVFPEFYGDWWQSCAKSLWEEIDRSKLVVDGASLREHLKQKGITSLGDWEPGGEDRHPLKGTFQHHVEQVEDDFWNNRFSVYTEWKKKWYEDYLKKGCFKTLTGFDVSGVFRKNEVINYPVQGSAFHCLLWFIIQLQKELRRLKMKTKLVGQVHDSVVADIAIDEIDAFYAIVRRIINVDLPAHWKWIIVPLTVEFELSPIGKSWWDKRPIEPVADSNNYKDKDGFIGTALEILNKWKLNEQPN
jgi:DNA polymerase-1